MTTKIEIKMKTSNLWKQKGILGEIIQDIQSVGRDDQWPLGKRVGVVNIEGDLVGSYLVTEGK